MVGSVDDLETPQSVGGNRFPNFEMLDAKTASALRKTMTPARGAKGSNGRPISQRKTDRVHDLCILPGDRRS